MQTLKAFRDFSEHDVIALYTYSGSFPVNKGTFVKIDSVGARYNDVEEIIGTPGASFLNTQSPRWGVAPKVVASTTTGEQIVGMLLYDGKELDENGNKLIYNPRKAAEMEVFISGQCAPLVTKGTFLYSGDRYEGTVTAGAKAYVSGGQLIVKQAAFASSLNVEPFHVGQFLGGTGADGSVLFRLNIVN